MLGLFFALLPAAQAADVALTWPAAPTPVDGYNVYFATTPLTADATGQLSVTKIYTANPNPDLGALPFAVAFPARPAIVREVVAVTIAEVNAAANNSADNGTRIRVRGMIPGYADIFASDIDVVLEPGARMENLNIRRGARRVRVRGGRFTGTIRTNSPYDLVYTTNGVFVSSTFNDAWFVEDVILEGLTVDNPNGLALSSFGRRVSVLHNRATSITYAFYGPGAEPDTATGVFALAEDLIVAGNVFRSDGVTPSGQGNSNEAGSTHEANIRYNDTDRSVFVGNHLTITLDGFIPPPPGSTCKANYRVHHKARNNFFARNIMVNGGIQMGSLTSGGPGWEELGPQWFVDNVFHHGGPDMFNPGGANGPGVVPVMTVQNNRVDTITSRDCVACYDPLPGWVESGNVINNNIPIPQWQASIPPAVAPVLLPPGGVVSRAVTGLAGGQTYYFRTAAVDLSDVEGGLSPELAVFIPDPGDSLSATFPGAAPNVPPAAPRGLRIQ